MFDEAHFLRNRDSARVLVGPTVETHRVESKSRPGEVYEITVDGGDVMCSCPGFEVSRRVRDSWPAGSVPCRRASRTTSFTGNTYAFTCTYAEYELGSGTSSPSRRSPSR